MVKYDKCYFYAGYKFYWMLNTLILKFLQEFLKSYESEGVIKVIVFFGQVYIPCILFVTVSWISFIIDPKVGKENIII